jgi:hypothetical protein
LSSSSSSSYSVSLSRQTTGKLASECSSSYTQSALHIWRQERKEHTRTHPIYYLSLCHSTYSYRLAHQPQSPFSASQSQCTAPRTY